MGGVVLSLQRITPGPRCEVYEHSHACRALEVIGQDWSRCRLSLEDWELARALMSQFMMRLFQKQAHTTMSKKPSGIAGRTSSRPVGGTGESTATFGESPPGLAFGFTACCCQPFVVAMGCSIDGAKILHKMWDGKASGLTWTHGMLCVCAHHPSSGIFR